MSYSFTDYFGIRTDDWSSTGATDIILDVDTKLFVDPALLRTTQVAELKDSYRKIGTFFDDLFLLLSQCKNEGDIFWTAAMKKLKFHEPKGTCLGYSHNDTKGNAFGKKLTYRLLQNAKRIIDAGFSNPRFFELIGVFQEKVGPDRISDMIVRIILEDLIQYSKNIYTKLDISNYPIHFKTGLLINPYNEEGIILVPKNIVQDLPLAESWENIDIICRENERVRQEINELIGDSWKQATANTSKEKLLSYLVLYPELINDLVGQYLAKEPKLYDFQKDRKGELIWYKAAKEYVSRYPLKLEKCTSSKELLALIIEICNQFKYLVENNGLHTLLYYDEGKTRYPKREEAAQKLFYGIADSYCKSNDIDIARECNSGRGPVDFKFSKGSSIRVLVEVKKANNSDLIHGMEVQLREYEKAENTTESIYLVLDIGDKASERNIQKLRSYIHTRKQDRAALPTIILIDARYKDSASIFIDDNAANK